MTIALRSIGVPTSFETVPQWANIDRAHHFYKVLDKENDTITKLIDNRNIPFDSRHVVPGSF